MVPHCCDFLVESKIGFVISAADHMDCSQKIRKRIICYDNAVNAEATESFLEVCKTKMLPTSVVK